MVTKEKWIDTIQDNEKLTFKEIIVITAMLFVIMVLSSCTSGRHVVLTDNRVLAHWMQKGDAAPYNGVLLNAYTYNGLVAKAKKCNKKKK